MKLLAVMLAAGMVVGASRLRAETCVTQSQMKEADRNALAGAAAALAARIQANDSAGVKALTIADFQRDFAGMADAIGTTSAKLKGAQAQVEQVYVLDGTTLAKTAAGVNPDAQFFCNLNQTTNEAEFAIPQLPPGKYGFAMVRMESPAPWRLSFLLRQEGGQWLLAGLYPKTLLAGGHDGLWYWKQARALNAGTGTAKEAWNAWLYFQEAQALLLPANFVSSTHLDKLQGEMTAAMPAAVSGGLSVDAPLVVKGADGTEFRFTAITVEDSLGNDKVDVAAHLKVEALGDAAAARKRNADAMAALVAAHPELRKAFHGVWVFAEVPGQAPYATEQAMAEIR